MTRQQHQQLSCQFSGDAAGEGEVRAGGGDVAGSWCWLLAICIISKSLLNLFVEIFRSQRTNTGAANITSATSATNALSITNITSNPRVLFFFGLLGLSIYLFLPSILHLNSSHRFKICNSAFSHALTPAVDCLYCEQIICCFWRSSVFK